VSFATVTLCVASERVCIVVSVYFVIGLVRKLSDTLSYENLEECHDLIYAPWRIPQPHLWTLNGSTTSSMKCEGDRTSRMPQFYASKLNKVQEPYLYTYKYVEW